MKTTNFPNRQAIIFTLTILTSSIVVQAQQQQTSNETTMTAKFGIKGGVNFANLYLDNANNEHMKLGGNIGFYAKLPLAQGLSLQPEFLYSTKGAKVRYDNAFQGSGEYRFNLNYVETPLLMVINLTRNFSLSAGGYIAYLTSANIKSIKSDGTVAGVNNLNADDFRRFDNGLIGGASVDIQNLTFGARYSYGFQKIGKSGNLSKDFTQNSRNNAISVFFGFAF